jgi:uncharacterized RDD family membrane protein YckC
VSCPSCGEALSGGSERCSACGAMVAPVVHGALAPDSRTLPARARGDAPRDLPGLRRREKNWQDEVRDRVRKRKKKRGDGSDLPLFESDANASAALDPVTEAEAVAGPSVPEVEQVPTPVVAERREWAAPAREERTPVFEGRMLDRVDPLDSLTDLPLRTPEIVAPPADAPAHDLLVQEFEASRSEAPPQESAELGDDDGWSVDAPLEPRLEPPPRLVDERPVERPAQALERAQAAAVDVVLLAGLSAVVVYFASRFAHVSIDGLRPSWPYLGAYLGFLALVYAVYFTGTTGQTLGKIVYGLRVVDTAGRPPGYLRAAGRAALGAVGVVLVGLGLVPVLFDPARRAFHDRLLHTRVIRG